MKRIVFLSVALVAWAFAAETNFTLPSQPMIGFPGNPRSSSVIQNAVTNQLSIVQYDAAATAALGGNWTVLASAIYNETLLELGWDYLYISPAILTEAGQSQAYYAAGYLEGALTNRSITNAGIVGSYEALPDNVRGWIDTHIGYINARSLAETTPFWVQVGLLMQQIQGLTDGYNMAVGKSAVTFKDMFVASFGDEVGDVNGTFYYPAPHKASRHCSALIKVTDTDLYVAHDTWSSFESMRRVYKVYVFNTTAAFSGYPGQIASGDDWYMTSNGLAIQETTNDFYNNSLYQFIKPRSVSEFLRVMTATYLAADGATWVQLFATENSGTYNNQYMVVNMNLWAPGQKGAKLQDNLLWVAEQIPGYVESQDVTQVLRDTSYWASYNVAYFPYIYNVSGFLAMYESEGSFWSYTDYARPEIFRREQAGVTTLSDMQKLMRYNHYETDPFSKIPNCSGCPVKGGVATCNPVNSAMLTIASRGDLNPLPNANVDGEPVCYGPLYFVGHRDHAATDSKIATWSNFQNGLLTGVAISGPTGVTQPYFQFSGSGIEQPVGMPNLYNFTWVSFALPVQWYYVAPHTGLPGDNKTVIGVVVAAAVIGAIFGGAALFVVRRRRQNVVAGYRDLPGAGMESRSAGHV